jgi:hypothetical protein
LSYNGKQSRKQKISQNKEVWDYSNWLGAGRPRNRYSSPSMVKNFPFSISSRPALGTTQPPV